MVPALQQGSSSRRMRIFLQKYTHGACMTLP